VTLSTSVIEGLNVFEVITADRMVAQVSTEHALASGHVPKVTFLGTRFENLRVAGYPVQIESTSQFAATNRKETVRICKTAASSSACNINSIMSPAPRVFLKAWKKQYDAKITHIDDLKKRANGRAKGERNGYPKLECSLVKSIGPIPIPGVRTFGNIIFIPDFGIVSLAEVEVGTQPHDDGFSDKTRGGSPQEPSDSNYFTLNMLNMHLGCIGGGTVKAGTVTANGTTRP